MIEDVTVRVGHGGEQPVRVQHRILVQLDHDGLSGLPARASDHDGLAGGVIQILRRDRGRSGPSGDGAQETADDETRGPNP